MDEEVDHEPFVPEGGGGVTDVAHAFEEPPAWEIGGEGARQDDREREEWNRMDIEADEGLARGPRPLTKGMDGGKVDMKRLGATSTTERAEKRRIPKVGRT